MVDDLWIPIPTHRTVVTARAEIQVPFACKHCGFESVARIVGRGSAATRATIAFVPAPKASKSDLTAAHERALAEGHELLAVVPCPKCARRGSEAWEAYTRRTRLFQALVAVLLLGILYGLWDPENPAVAVVCAIPMFGVVFVVGYLRGVRADLSTDRVRFLSPEEVAASAAMEPHGERGKKRRKQGSADG